MLQTRLSATAIADMSRLPHALLCVITHCLVELYTDCESVTSREILSLVASFDGGPPVSVHPHFCAAGLDDFQQQVSTV